MAEFNNRPRSSQGNRSGGRFGSNQGSRFGSSSQGNRSGGRFGNNQRNRFSGRSNFKRNFESRQMHKATCSKCGKECEVPFKPTQGRDVLCNDCFRQK
ncbi:MAG: CxxC-x17-CxxC domain-containing protein [Candidatus Pacearchaeota archaeon]